MEINGGRNFPFQRKEFEGERENKIYVHIHDICFVSMVAYCTYISVD